MSWATVEECRDESVEVLPEDLERAASQVALRLWEIGVEPAEVPAPQPVLRDLQVAWALHSACVRSAAGEDSPLFDKADRYRTQARDLSAPLSRRALSLESSAGAGGSGVGSISIGRG